jgi:hypothetical protein
MRLSRGQIVGAVIVIAAAVGFFLIRRAFA